MKSINKYIGWIANYSGLRIATFFAIFYFGMVCIFGTSYYLSSYFDFAIISGVPKPSGILDFLFFSFVTQSTLGDAFLWPINNYGRFMIVIQVAIGIFLFAIGTGTVIVRALIPDNDDIWFHDNLLYDHKQNCFKFCLANDLPIDIHNASIRLGITYYDLYSHKSKVKNIELAKNKIDLMSKEHEPYILSTKKFENSKVRELRSFTTGYDVVLEPKHVISKSKKKCELKATLVAQHFAGFISKTKEYSLKDNIRCGDFFGSYYRGFPLSGSERKGFDKINKKVCEGVCNYPHKSKCLLKDFVQ